MTFDFDSEVPIYLQVAEEIQDAILCGAFPEDTQVPSTTEISVTYKINPATVLKGMTLLTEDGVLYKKRGVGMFVSPGAAGQIRQKRRRQFYETYIVKLINEAEKLDISQGEILQMIRSGRKDGIEP